MKDELVFFVVVAAYLIAVMLLTPVDEPCKFVRAGEKCWVITVAR